ncbi:tyrosine-protein phosphatase non-receptor type substrate 1-like [Mobula hypostoma]|uniref:tyrosine-protein phosphatase non-receptor type substrate 1-like n=1 Tax=Mobula hypostoma TaxID=723540 RepID=UPI002FC3C131
MQIFDLLQYLLVLQITYTVADRASFTVNQIPEQVTKTKGENVSIYCTYPIFAQNSLVDVYWRKGGQKQFIDATADRRMSIITSEQGSAEFHILGVSFGDSGIYYCSVRDWTRKFSQGNGTNVIVHVPPAPLKITEVNAPSAALTCTTAAFFPKDYKLIWYKNEFKITSGMHTTRMQNEEGLYLVSSSLNVTESGYVYTCQVFHESMKEPASESYRIILESRDKFILILTGAFAACGVIILALLLLIRRFRVDKTEVVAESDENLSRYLENQIIQGTEDTLMYACVDLAASQKNARRVQKTHETEYAGIKIKEEARNMETKRATYSY